MKKSFVLFVGQHTKIGFAYLMVLTPLDHYYGDSYAKAWTKKLSTLVQPKRKISFEGNYYWTTCSQHKKCNSSQKVENV